MARSKPKKKVRGPSRPVDPRYVPRYVVARPGPDGRLIGLAGGGIALVVVLVLVIALLLNRSGVTSGAGGTSGQQPAAGVPGPTASAEALSTALASAPRISDQDALNLLNSGQGVIIDVRPPDAQGNDPYKTAHIKGAKHIVFTEIGQHLDQIPKQGTVVVYCE